MFLHFLVEIVVFFEKVDRGKTTRAILSIEQAHRTLYSSLAGIERLGADSCAHGFWNRDVSFYYISQSYGENELVQMLA